jgi:hypothetical protein
MKSGVVRARGVLGAAGVETGGVMWRGVAGTETLGAAAVTAAAGVGEAMAKSSWGTAVTPDEGGNGVDGAETTMGDERTGARDGARVRGVDGGTVASSPALNAAWTEANVGIGVPSMR